MLCTVIPKQGCKLQTVYMYSMFLRKFNFLLVKWHAYSYCIFSNPIIYHLKYTHMEIVQILQLTGTYGISLWMRWLNSWPKSLSPSPFFWYYLMELPFICICNVAYFTQCIFTLWSYAVLYVQTKLYKYSILYTYTVSYSKKMCIMFCESSKVQYAVANTYCSVGIDCRNLWTFLQNNTFY